MLSDFADPQGFIAFKGLRRTWLQIGRAWRGLIHAADLFERAQEIL
jgi:hypothetical protein